MSLHDGDDSGRRKTRTKVEECGEDPAKDSYLMAILEKRHPETFARIMAQRLAAPKPEPLPMAHVDLTSFSAASLRRGGTNRQRGRPKKRYGVEAVRIQAANRKWNGSWQEAATKALKVAKVR